MMQMHKRVIAKFLSFPDRLALVNEHKKHVDRLLFLEKRYNIDKIIDSGEAKEIKSEMEKIRERIEDILKELSF